MCLKTSSSVGDAEVWGLGGCGAFRTVTWLEVGHQGWALKVKCDSCLTLNPLLPDPPRHEQPPHAPPTTDGTMPGTMTNCTLKLQAKYTSPLVASVKALVREGKSSQYYSCS